MTMLRIATMMRMLRILLCVFKGGNLYHNNLPGRKESFVPKTKNTKLKHTCSEKENPSSENQIPASANSSAKRKNWQSIHRWNKSNHQVHKRAIKPWHVRQQQMRWRSTSVIPRVSWWVLDSQRFHFVAVQACDDFWSLLQDCQDVFHRLGGRQILEVLERLLHPSSG